MDSNERNAHGHCDTCTCGGYNGGISNHMLLRIFLGLLIIGFIFWGGVAVGVLIGSIGGSWDEGYGGPGYGPYGGPHRMMMYDDPYGAYLDEGYGTRIPGMPMRPVDVPDAAVGGTKVK